MADSSEVGIKPALGSSDPKASVQAYNLLEALRHGDTETIQKLLSEECNTLLPLHLAIKCATASTVQLVLSLAPHLINAKDSRGQTPLHIAASLNRLDVLELLLTQDGIADNVKDNAGATCLEVGGDSSVVDLIFNFRARHNEKYVELLSEYVASPPANTSASIPPASATKSGAGQGSAVSAASGHVSNAAAEKLYHFIARPRYIYLSAQDPSGTTLLHEASRRKDLGLIKLVLSRGGDVMARDRSGKTALELAQDERIKSVLSSAEPAPGTASNLGPPSTMRGFLSKWTNMARGYRSRWFVLENGTLSYYRNQDEEGKAVRGAINMSVAILHASTAESLKFEISSKLGKSYPSFFLKATHHSEASRWIEALRLNIEYAKEPLSLTRTGSGASNYIASLNGEGLGRRSSAIRRTGERAPDGDRDGSVLGDDETYYGETDGASVPRAEDFELLASTWKSQLETTQQLVRSLGAGGVQMDVKQALESSLGSLNASLAEYVDVVGQRERYFSRKFERETEIKRLWEQTMSDVATSHAQVEQSLALELEKSRSDNLRKRAALVGVRANILAASPATTPNVVTAEPGEYLTANPDLAGLPSLVTPSGQARSPIRSLSPRRTRAATLMRPLDQVELEELVESALAGDAESDEEDEEFFEAIESGAINITEDLPISPERAAPSEEYLQSMDLTPYKGYENLRTKLPIDTDNRPPVSLWAILKSSIGKDLSKISFPVFFNEPTSMLQRMSEDLEFSECLDAAAAERDPTKRIAFVAAFAMSNYSSTIGRIAKPFNPMLGETFEFVDTKKSFRYYCEQVSHHPPISAGVAQAASWEFFGSIDAKSSFKGKSFDITPAGLCHVMLRIPKEWSPNLPAAPERFPGMVVEHYSWTKVTTSVSGFLMGTVSIDHFGDMIITNHRTNLKAILTFKPRGWRGSGAAEIKGKVIDQDGVESWAIAGKWSSQLVARRSGGKDRSELAPDVTIPTSAGGQEEEYIRLWKNSIKPIAPFNLTTYAIGLNDTNDELRSWLPPSDSRIRPDRAAFEAGAYEKANDLKTALEEFQRTTRKARDKGERGEHKPRWFDHKMDKDTGELYWSPAVGTEGSLEYWEERTRVGKAHQRGEEAEWKDVERIFGDIA